MKNKKASAALLGKLVPFLVISATLLGLWASYLQIKTYYANKKKAALVATK